MNQFDEITLRDRFRVYKEVVLEITTLLEPRFLPCLKEEGLYPVSLQVLITLRFLAL